MNRVALSLAVHRIKLRNLWQGWAIRRKASREFTFLVALLLANCTWFYRMIFSLGPIVLGDISTPTRNSGLLTLSAWNYQALGSRNIEILISLIEGLLGGL